MQILNPNPDAMSKMITENASEEFLYSLSNYCALQVGKMLIQSSDFFYKFECQLQILCDHMLYWWCLVNHHLYFIFFNYMASREMQ